MSKIYEALRQKEQEDSFLRPVSRAGETITQTGDFSFAALELADEVLQAAVSADESVPIAEELQDRSKRLPEVEFSPDKKDSGPKRFQGDFRRRRLAYREESRLVFQSDPDGLAAQQFRFLRRALEQKFPTGAVLLITSPAPKDGKTLTALNLSACLADSGRSTLLLEADIRQPTVHKLLGGPTASGIEKVLAGTADPTEVVQFVEELSLHVAMVAEPPADPSRLVGGTGVKHLLAWAREHFDWVVVDSPPVLPAADVAQFTTLADAVLLVVRAKGTPRHLTTRAFELLGSHLSGVILNEATIESNPYYRYLTEYRQKNVALGSCDATSQKVRRS